MLKRLLCRLGIIGSGRTVCLANALKNHVESGDGFIYIDGKGDYMPMQEVSAKAQESGRSDEVLVLNLDVPPKPNFLNETNQIKSYDNYLESMPYKNDVSGEEIVYEIVSSEFLSKFGLGDGLMFQDLANQVMDKIDSGILDIDESNFYNDDFPSFAKQIIEIAILDKEPLFKEHVKCIDGRHNPCRIYNEESAPLEKMPYKTWKVTKKEALTIIYDLFKHRCDVKDVSLNAFLSKFELYCK